MNRIAILSRFKESDQGTLGILVTDGFKMCTIELPWKDNKLTISCIPTGKYLCQYRTSVKYREHYWVTNVGGRTWILTHSGNFAGDAEQGYITHSSGCIIVGKYHGKINNQDAVLLSRPTLREFVYCMKKQPFTLEVKNAF